MSNKDSKSKRVVNDSKKPAIAENLVNNSDFENKKKINY